MAERKALLILHGKQATNDEVRAAVGQMRERGWSLDVRLTWEAGDAQRLVDEALADLIEKRKQTRPRPSIMAAYQASHETFAPLYRKLAE